MATRPMRSVAAAAAKPTPDWRDMWSCVVAVFAVGAASRIGQVSMYPNFSDWYEGLTKPWFTPHDVVFGYVWGPLYFLMTVALWRIRSMPAKTPGKDRAVALFLVMLTVGALWSIAFFRLESPLLGLVDIVAQWLLIVATIVAFWRLDLPSALALVPLGCWIAFVTVLNFGILRLN
jgi:translocator protein